MGSPRHRRNGVRGKRERAGGTRRERRGRPRDHRGSSVVLALTAYLVLACGGSAKKAPTAARRAEAPVDFTLIDSPSLQFLPRHEEAKGWRLEEDPAVVPGERIGTYLGPDGQHFAHYEVVDVTAGKYTALDGSGGF